MGTAIAAMMGPEIALPEAAAGDEVGVLVVKIVVAGPGVAEVGDGAFGFDCIVWRPLATGAFVGNTLPSLVTNWMAMSDEEGAPKLAVSKVMPPFSAMVVVVLLSIGEPLRIEFGQNRANRAHKPNGPVLFVYRRLSLPRQAHIAVSQVMTPRSSFNKEDHRGK